MAKRIKNSDKILMEVMNVGFLQFAYVKPANLVNKLALLDHPDYALIRDEMVRVVRWDEDFNQFEVQLGCGNRLLADADHIHLLPEVL